MKQLLSLAAILFFTLFVEFCVGQPGRYQSFENLYLDTESSTITSFAQDKKGLMWIGTIKGLYSYDGYSFHAHNSGESSTSIQIHCIQADVKGILYLGTDSGILVYNYTTDKYENTIPVTTSVRAMVLINDEIWIGTLNGLYKYNIRNKTVRQVDKQGTSLPSQTIYAIERNKNRLFIGTYNGLCSYDLAINRFTKIPLPSEKNKSNTFVNSLLVDNTRNYLWVGTEGSLFKLSLSNLSAARVSDMEHNSVKTMALDSDKRLLIGTDNGLYIYSKDGDILHIAHDSRISTSLSNNIIWSIFRDSEGNSWLGTDYGISLSKQNSILNFTPIAAISGSGDGNRFSAIFKDSRSFFWFGGENGLIVRGKNQATVWYKMGSNAHPLSHNRVRKIYEDKSSNLWVATDGSLNRYNSSTHQFVNYTIQDSSKIRNANWCYDIAEDANRNYWIASFLGGIFIANKDKLLKSDGCYLAEQNLTTRNGLSENYVTQLVPDKHGNIWALFRNRTINVINTITRKIQQANVNNYLNGEKPNLLFCDGEGFIWVGFKGGIARLSDAKEKPIIARFDEFNPKEVLAIEQENNHLWISTANAVWVVDRHSMTVVQCLRATRQFSSLFYDNAAQLMYLGSTDGFATTSLSKIRNTKKKEEIVLTALYINNRIVQNLPNSDKSIRYVNELKVKHNQNNLTFEFSDLDFSANEKSYFVYKLDGIDNQWSTLKQESNRISYSNLSPGSYKLTICKLSSAGQPSSVQRTITVKILPPWYLTLLAKALYFMLFIGSVVWVISFFTMKNRLKMERQEKERSLEQSKIKFDFFTNISHDIKTPLSLIIAPLAKLLYETKDNEQKIQLRLAHQNAMKLNSLIHQALDFDKVEHKSNPQLFLSKVDFIEFARSLFSVFNEAPRDKNINMHFESNCSSLFIDVDIVKMESVLDNLISNAIKFTPDGGSVVLTVTHNQQDKSLKIDLKDTGIGISENELPHIFQRFYQGTNSETKEGTGIGLYLVKIYTELHNGMVSIVSKEKEGTAISLTIPIKDYSVPQQQSIDNINEQGSRPRILIVEDNSDIANVICSTLGSRYQYIKASNGKIGLDIVLDAAPDAIISDYMMPVMDGLEMCRKLRKNTPTATTPFILLTAKISSEVEKESIRLRIDSYITKPFDPDLLKLKVEQIIQTSRKMEEKVRLETLATPKANNLTSINEKFLSEIISIIEENISNSDFNVNELCTIADISPKQLYRRIKQLTGFTPVDYIRSIRMKKAAMLLQQKKFTVAEVMYMVGFSNHSYFSKCFQSAFGKTPRNYLEENA